MHKCKAAVVLAVLVGVALAAGCGPKSGPRQASLADLQARVDQMWKALVDMDFASMYNLHTPEYRQKVSESEYATNLKNAFRTVRYTIEGIEISEDGKSATAYVTNTFIVPFMPIPKTRPSQPSQWVLENGIWYFWETTDRTPMLSGTRQPPAE